MGSNLIEGVRAMLDQITLQGYPNIAGYIEFRQVPSN